jgi:hypothetical protein
VKSSQHALQTPSVQPGNIAAPACLFPPYLSAAFVSRRPSRGSLVLLALIVTALLLSLSSPAPTKRFLLFPGAFGAAASTPPNPYPLASGPFGPSSVAVDDQTGDVYVTDQGDRRVEKFTSSGQFILMFGKDVDRTNVEKAGSTEAEQNLCTAASGDTCQFGAQSSSPEGFDSANASELNEQDYMFVAVDNSTGPSVGDVSVADSADHLITKFDSTGHLVSTWGNNGPFGAPNGQLNSSAAEGLAVKGPFGAVESTVEAQFDPFIGIATDVSGDLWVGDQTGGANRIDRVFRFGQESSFRTVWAGGSQFDGVIENGPFSIAVDSQDNLYTSGAKYSAEGHWFGSLQLSASGIQIRGVAVDPATDQLYTDGAVTGGPTAVQRYASCNPVEIVEPCTPAETFGAGRFSELGAGGLAVDPSTASDPLYVAEIRGEVAAFAVKTVPDVQTQNASGFTPASAVLNGSVDPSGVPLSECFFEWGLGNEPYEHRAECEPSAATIGSTTTPVAVHADISGLQPNRTYHFRLHAANANDVNKALDEPSLGEASTFGPPLLTGSSVAAVSSAAATLQAQINPDAVDTHVRFEYGAAAGVYDHVTPDIDLGTATAAQSVSQGLQDLTPHTTYHYRAVAQNLFGAVEGEDHAFTTQGQVSFGLPDDRAWELVSPPDKRGIPLEAITNQGSDIQAAADGDSFAYIAKGPINSEAAGNRSPAFTQLLARRGSAGWSTQDLATPNQVPVGIEPARLSEYKLFSTDLSNAVLEPRGATPLSPLTTERTPYLRQPDGEYTPLVSAGNVPSGTKFGGVFEGTFKFGVSIVTATPNLTHVVLQSPSVLTEPSFKANGTTSLYEWSAGSLSLVSQIPAGTATDCGGAGPACVPAAAKGIATAAGNDGDLVRHALSADGSRVIFNSSTGHLFMRDAESEETIQLDVPVAGAEGGNGGPPHFQDASADDSKVFFTDTARLTPDSTGRENAEDLDLYMCEIGVIDGHQHCTLKDLTSGSNPGESADVQSDLLGTSEDGRFVYFVANGVLASGAVSGNCINVNFTTSAHNSCNLYLRDTATETTTLVAVLSNADGNDWGSFKEGGLDLGFLTARVSPNGRWLAFMSERSLTGYDNHDASTGEPDQEVYLYHAGSDGQAGRLLCASCNPTGARPVGVLDQGGTPGMLVDRSGIWGGERQRQRLAASIPGWTSVDGTYALYQSRYLSDSGRLFFNAADALVPQDSNSTEDVYQYEPSGVGSCTELASTFSSASSGCVDLLSSGTSGEESAFLDASESGDDVFFLTASRLASTDVDSALDVYDARVAGISPAPVNPVECSGDACQQPATAPSDATPGSLTFNGAGNLAPPAPVVKPKARALTRAQLLGKALKACHGKQDKHKRTACERQARKRDGLTRAKGHQAGHTTTTHKGDK